jgi:aspartate ammonia-lyase
MNNNCETRIERDFIGVREIPAAALYGINSLRAAENFALTGRKIAPEAIRAIGMIKKSAAQANRDLQIIAPEK